MKLVLCSSGFHTQNTVEACVKLVGKPQGQISVGIINEAFAFEEGDKRWVLNDLNAVASNFSAEIDIINLLALSIEEVEDRLSKMDVIFMIGGYADYLMSVFQKTGFDKLLLKLLKTKVYVGSSAGSMVIGKRIPTEAYKMIYDDDNKLGINQYMNLVDLSIMPHIDACHFPDRKKKLLNAINSFESKVYGLRDDSAIIVDGDTISTIGSKPIIIEKGQILSNKTV